MQEQQNNNVTKEQQSQEDTIKEQENTAEQENQSQEDKSQQKIEELEAKLSESNDKMLRVLAELDNTRRRAKEDLEKSAKFAISGFVSELVTVVENFFLASQNAPKEEIAKVPAIKNYADAITMTEKELLKILEKNKVKRIYPQDQKFDHNLHEAISQVESDKEEGTVVQVIQSGYTIADRLIRPALVGVSRGK